MAASCRWSACSSGEFADGAVFYGASGQEARTAGLFALMRQHAREDSPRRRPATRSRLGRLEGMATGETLSTAKGSTPQLVKIDVSPGVYGLAISVSDRKDEVKLTSAIAKLIEEDPSLSLEHNHDTHEIVLWGQGEMHLRVALERLENKFGVKANSRPRRIAYKETIRKPTQIRGRHKKQSGGHGQFGDVVVEIKPLGARRRLRVHRHDHRRRRAEAVYSGGGAGRARLDGARARWAFAVVDFTVNLSDGSYHDVDSSEMAFKTAARIAMSEGMPQCSPVLLEPIVAVDIHVPSDATSRINQIVTGRRGQLLGLRRPRRLARLGHGQGAYAGKRDRLAHHRTALGDGRCRHLHLRA